MICVAWPAGHLVHALLNDAQTLAYLFNVDDGAIIAIAGGGNWYVEFKLVVASVRLLLAEVPCKARRAKVRSSHAPFDRFINSAAANTFRAHLEKAVAHDRALVLLETRRHVL